MFLLWLKMMSGNGLGLFGLNSVVLSVMVFDVLVGMWRICLLRLVVICGRFVLV